MAGTVSAHLRGPFVLTHRLAEGYCSITELLFSHYRTMSAFALQLAALAHLSILGLTEIWPHTWPGARLILSLLVITGLLLVITVLKQLPTQPAGASTHSPANAFLAGQITLGAAGTDGIAFGSDTAVPLSIAADLSHFALTPREIALERQSQRLVEIADTAMRSRGEAERRGQAWADLMSKVSHELRTPLNAVIGFSDVMNAELFGPVGHPRYREYVNHIRDSGRALLKSAEDTLALTALLASPGSIAKPEVLRLEDFTSEAWDFVSLDGTAGHLTLKSSGLQDLELLGERRPLRQILINLFSAAAARAAPGSSIEISARQDGDIVEVEIAVPTQSKTCTEHEGALPLSLARALLELQDSFLIELTTPAGGWRVVTVLAVATQQDFFAMPRMGPQMAVG